ncbi:MAG: hypothetical protein HY886_02195 [Deltaproteobacteria bacterium]|nr:hypothetical protein [Deltaproteobacteria bacterium]
MKIYRLSQLAADTPGGEYRLGSNELKMEEFTLLYGALRPHEAGRKIIPSSGAGVVCVIKGSINVKCGRTSFSAISGSAFPINNGQECVFDNVYDTEAAYIIANGKAGASVTADAAEKAAAGQPENEPAAIKEPQAIRDESEYIITKDEAIS